MRRIRLANLSLGDPDDIEIFAGAAVWNWTQTDNGRRIVEQFDITTDKMYWTRGTFRQDSYSITVDIWADIDKETEVLMKLSGFLPNR
jgi:hypothetical protein